VFSPRQGNASLAADIISCGHWFGCAWLVSPWTDLTLSSSTLLTKDVVDPRRPLGYVWKPHLTAPQGDHLFVGSPH